MGQTIYASWCRISSINSIELREFSLGFLCFFLCFFFGGGCERFFSTNSKLSVFLVVDVMFLFAGRGVRFLSPKMILVGFKMPWSLWVFKCFLRDYTPSLIGWNLIYGRTFTSILVAMFFQTCLKLRQKVLFCRPQGSQNCLMRKFRCDPGPSVFFFERPKDVGFVD